ncbi:uncharacterized protein TRAVEDRAFT_28750 [Trametes versicolor FP-101664 SS1]|uniref:uncharacterized protein n=1 Tax=Trametes versicolor (strain FP-101664) TaxID=717944 RepID=UPI00046215C0|nr:uncharacterized protein TRAVEDRAFT_28750 [Trametes versicolor FP-101664 SS1]EIW59720.1 hypothetical protein TRAVEDRAFT_28750 [Trametes versicolor FP-101664 SS1]
MEFDAAPMEVAFLTDDPLDSVVIDALSGDTLYTIKTSPKLAFGKRTTTVCDAQGRAIAQYRRRWVQDQVELNGVAKNVNSWLPRDGPFSSSRGFLAPNGRTYVWKRLWGQSRFQLIDRQTDQVVAQSEGASPTRCMGIEFLSAVAPILDTLVLSFIICEDDRRDQETLLAPTAVDSE